MAEEIVISNENKIRVGKLIRVYQKEKGITLFDLVDSVCSRQVATNFNKGIPAKNDDPYLGTLAKLGFSYNYMHDIDDYILQQCKQLKDAVEWYDTKLMEKICLETIERLESYSKYIIEYEYLRAFKAIHKFHFVNIKIEDESNHFLETMKLLNEDIMELLKNIIFKYCYRFYDSNMNSETSKKANYIYNELLLGQSSYSVNQLNYVVYLLSLKYHFDSLRILMNLEKEYSNKKNYNGLLWVYNRLFWLIGNIQDKSLDRYEDDFNKILFLKKEVLNIDLVIQGQMNLAINYFEKGNFIKAKRYFLETINNKKFYVKSAICLKFIAYYENDFSNDFVMNPINICENITDREKVFYEYYYLKSNNNDMVELINYINLYVLSNIESKESFYYSVFNNELNFLSNHITNYSESIRRKFYKIIDKFRRL